MAIKKGTLRAATPIETTIVSPTIVSPTVGIPVPLVSTPTVGIPQPAFVPPPSTPANWFAGIDDVDGSGRAPKMDVGDHIFTVDSIAVINGYKGAGFIILGTILESTNANNHAGSTRSIIINGLKDNDRIKSALGQIKNFLAAAFKVDVKLARPTPDYTWEQLINFMIGGQISVQGMEVGVTITQGIGGRSGKPYYTHSFSIVESSDAE